MVDAVAGARVPKDRVPRLPRQRVVEDAEQDPWCGGEERAQPFDEVLVPAGERDAQKRPDALELLLLALLADADADARRGRGRGHNELLEAPEHGVVVVGELHRRAEHGVGVLLDQDADGDVQQVPRRRLAVGRGARREQDAEGHLQVLVAAGRVDDAQQLREVDVDVVLALARVAHSAALLDFAVPHALRGRSAKLQALHQRVSSVVRLVRADVRA